MDHTKYNLPPNKSIIPNSWWAMPTGEHGPLVLTFIGEKCLTDSGLLQCPVYIDPDICRLFYRAVITFTTDDEACMFKLAYGDYDYDIDE